MSCLPALECPTPGTVTTRQPKGTPNSAALRRAASKKCQPQAKRWLPWAIAQG